jgi:Transposase DNA-binding/Transposase DDE domain
MSESDRRRVVREEFADVDLGDERRSRRAIAIAEKLAANPEASLPDAMGHRATTEALYRHLSNEDVTLSALLEPHIVRTVHRVERAGLAFAVSDTTEFKFTGEKPRPGLGPINRTAQGFLTHVTLAVSADGKRVPLGLLALEAWARNGFKNTRRRKIWKHRRDATRESLRWGRGMEAAARRAAGASLIHVADRDCDIYDVIAQLRQDGQRFVLRAAQDRRLVPLDKQDAERLFEAAQTTPTKYTVEVPVTARGDGVNRPTALKKKYPKRGSRLACVSVAARSVTLKRPLKASPTLPGTLTINIVHVFELGPPPGQPPVEWLLLTSEPTCTHEEIAFVIEGYRTRWVVEEYFKAVKTGCAFESKQLESFHTLTNMLAFVMVVAYALLLMRTFTNTITPEPATSILSVQQVEILRACTHQPLPQHMTVREALLAVAALGGHLKNNGDPGWRVLSRGWRKLLDYERGYALAAGLRSDQS